MCDHSVSQHSLSQVSAARQVAAATTTVIKVLPIALEAHVDEEEVPRRRIVWVATAAAEAKEV